MQSYRGHEALSSAFIRSPLGRLLHSAAEAAAISAVEVGEAAPAIRQVLKDVRIDGPSPGFAFRNGRAFGIRWRNQGI